MSEPLQDLPIAVTAGEQDHSDPWQYAGEEADAPTNPEDDAGPVLRSVPAPGEVLRGAASWRNCQASITLVDAINARWPGRDKASDGTIGDAAHATRVSDHNPWVKDSNGMGVVRARDVDKDGIDAAWIVEELRKLGAAGDRRLRNQGYVIFNRRITSPDFSHWNVYNGSNPHDKHFHVSYSVDQAGYDDASPWAFLSGGVAPTPAPPPAPPGVQYENRVDAAPGARVVKLGSVGKDVGFVQRWHGIADDDHFGPATEGKVRETQQRNGVAVDGVVGPVTWRLMGIGGQPPAPPKPAIPAPPALGGWTLPRGHYYGHKNGPAKSHGGFYPHERDEIKRIQQRLIAKGYVPGIADWRSGWADGIYEDATVQAVTRFQRAEMPGTRFFGQVWADDWARLAR